MIEWIILELHKTFHLDLYKHQKVVVWSLCSTFFIFLSASWIPDSQAYHHHSHQTFPKFCQSKQMKTHLLFIDKNLEEFCTISNFSCMMHNVYKLKVLVFKFDWFHKTKLKLSRHNLLNWFTCSALRFFEIFENSFLEMNPSWFLSRALKARWALLVTSISDTTRSLFLSRLANSSEWRQ